MGLADAGWPVEQQAALEVLARLAQPVAVAGDADHLAPYVGERGLRQHQRLAGDLLPVVEPQRRPALAEHRVAEQDHLSSVDVVLEAELPQPRRHPAAGLGVVGHDLRRDLAVVVVGVGAPVEQRDAVAAVGGEDDRGAEALAGLPVRTRGQRHPCDVAGPGAAPAVAVVTGDQLGHAERAAVAVAGEADDALHATLEPRVERHLDVDVLVRRPVLLGDRQLRRLGLEEVAHDAAEPRPLRLARLLAQRSTRRRP